MTPVVDVEYEQPACPTRHAWARVPVEPSPSERSALKERIARLLKEKNAVMVSHYYVHPDLQDLAEATGGLVSDSLEMARFGRDHAATTLVVSPGRTAMLVLRSASATALAMRTTSDGSPPNCATMLRITSQARPAATSTLINALTSSTLSAVL